MLLYQILVYIIHGKIQKNHIITISLKYQLKGETKNLNYLTDRILYKTLKTIPSVLLKS